MLVNTSTILKKDQERPLYDCCKMWLIFEVNYRDNEKKVCTQKSKKCAHKKRS